MHVYQNYLCTSTQLHFTLNTHTRDSYTWRSLGWFGNHLGFARLLPHKSLLLITATRLLSWWMAVYACICRGTGTHCRLQQPLTKPQTFQAEHVYAIIHYIYAKCSQMFGDLLAIPLGCCERAKTDPDGKICMQTGGSARHKLHWHSLLLKLWTQKYCNLVQTFA